MKIIFTIALFFIFTGCASGSKNSSTRQSFGNHPIAPGMPKPALALIPKAKAYTGEVPAVIQDILPSSVAAKYHFQLGDKIIKLNGESIPNALTFEKRIKEAPTNTTIVFQRGRQLKNLTVRLGMERPRFGAGFEPEGVALFKKSSPNISFMHKKGITAFTETSMNEDEDLLHLNVILNSTKFVPAAQMRYTVVDRGTSSLIGKGTERIDALGTGARVFKKAFHKNKGFKGPISVALDVEGKQFHFEFQ